MLEIYYTPNTSALAPHIVLEEVGAAYKAIRIDFASSEQQGPDYLRINPKGRVPALVTASGVLTEVPALLVYLAQAHPAARLVPFDDPFAFAQLQEFNSFICSTLHVAHSHRMRGYRWADDPQAIAAMQRKVPQSVGEAFDLIERYMFRGPWAMGETYTVVDPYLFTMAQWMESDGVDPQRFPRIQDHRDRMRARPAVQRALAREFAVP